MRIGSSIILLNGYCFQSYQWKFLRPLGSLHNVLKFLDQYNVDEICIIRPVRKEDSYLSFINDLNQIQSSLSNSPISLGGGIRLIRHINLLKDLPIERLHLSNVFLEKNMQVINKISNLYGKQALVATLPIKCVENDLLVYHGARRAFVPLKVSTLDLINEYADELMIIDVENEGSNESFNFKILDNLKFQSNRLIISGGIGPTTIIKAKEIGLASCIIDNRVLHNENYIKTEL